MVRSRILTSAKTKYAPIELELQPIVYATRKYHTFLASTTFKLGATLSLAYRGSLDPGHILYELLAGSTHGYRERLKSRRPFVPAARKLLQDLTELDIRAAQ